MSDKQSFFYKAYSPYVHAGITMGLAVLFILVGKIVEKTNLTSMDATFSWMVVSAFMLLFAVSNSIFSLSSGDFNSYFGKSVMSYLGLGFTSGIVAWLVSGININDAGSYRWILVVVTFAYLVFLSMVNFIKRIVEFAQKEEWNQPRLRNRK